MKLINRKIKSNVILVYGFRKNKPNYDMIMTLSIHRGTTYVHGFISIYNLKFIDYLHLWKHLKTTVKTKYLEIEIVDKFARYYEEVLPNANVKKDKTFNGWKCKKFTVRMDNENSINKNKLKEISVLLGKQFSGG